MSSTFSRYEFTGADFNYISSLIYEQTGIRLTTSKQELVYARLAKRLRALGLQNFREYCDMLRGGDAEELRTCINAITTNVTAFFRELHHFEFLDQVMLPERVRQAEHTGKKRLRIWSAGCSSGEEPYSIAMILAEHTALRHWDVRILATDLDSGVLEKASAGIYSIDQANSIPALRLKRWFRKGAGEHKDRMKVVPELQQRITFRQLNLNGEWPLRGPFDAIFCRNVVIYFDKETQKRLFNRYAELLGEPGYLFLGHSESLHGISDRYQLAGKTIYRKIK